jgi:hypothetical protein
LTPRVDFLAYSLLGAHVVSGAQDGALPGHVLGCPVAGGDGVLHAAGLRGGRMHPSLPGQAEIQNLDLTHSGQHDVLWLEVAVDDSGGMRGREAIRNLGGNFKQFAYGKCFAVEQRA